MRLPVAGPRGLAGARRAACRQRLVIIALTAAAAVACHGDSPATPPEREPPVPSAPAAVASIVISPAKGRVDAGAAMQLVIIATAADGSVVPASVQWSSDAHELATVDASGVVRGQSPGYVRITARSGAASDFAMIHVQRDGSYPDRVDILPADSLLDSCSVRQYTAVTVPDVGVDRFGWRSGDTTVVHMTSDGTARAVRAGTTSITAQWLPDTSRWAARRITVTPCASHGVR